MQKKNKKTQYVGESGQNSLTRGKSHKRDFESKSQKSRDQSAMYKHMTVSHMEEVEKGLREAEIYFTMTVRKCYMEPLTRQADEGTTMRMSEGTIINSKKQWHQPALARTIVIRGGAEVLQNNEFVE
jgi:hypothetical protein